jgi:hypothetical protein
MQHFRITFLHKTIFAKKKEQRKNSYCGNNGKQFNYLHSSSVTNSPVLIVGTSIIAVGFKSKRGRIFVGMY